MTTRGRTTERLSLPAARRMALAAQGLAARRPAGRVTMRHVQAQIDRLAQLQVDSVNVLTRAHYMPLYARLGPGFDPALLDRAANQAPRRLFEYWGHAASLIDVRLYPALRFRMDQPREPWTEESLIERVHADVLAAGRPVTARQVDAGETPRRDHWGWNWSQTKQAMEYLHTCGRVVSAGRNSQFERAYDVAERVLPAAVVEAPALPADQAHVVLVERAARALGVASDRCLADYFRTGLDPTRRAIDALVGAGTLVPVDVEGWRRPTYVHAGAARPRKVNARALLSPFDSLVFERERLLALFGVDYRIEIYVPAPKRRWGYYVYLFLLGERIVARVDLKADRRAGVLVVQAAWREPSVPAADDVVVPELAAELADLASWLGLSQVTVAGPGDLAPALACGL